MLVSCAIVGAGRTMGHARANDLRDLRDELAEIRARAGGERAATGRVLAATDAFLHFHTTGDFRRAHAKIGRVWGPEIVLPFGASRAARAAFLREIRARYDACVSAQPLPRGRRRATP